MLVLMYVNSRRPSPSNFAGRVDNADMSKPRLVPSPSYFGLSLIPK